MMQSAEARCLVCGGREVSFFNRFGKWTLLRCSSDGFIFVHPLPGDGEIKGFYNSGEYFNSTDENRKFGYRDYLHERKTAEINDKNILLRIEKWLPAQDDSDGSRAPKLLDVGAAYGFFMESARKKGFTVFGNDFSEEAVNHAKTRDLTIALGTTKGQNYASNYFDIVTILGVIEHFRDPVGEIEEIARILKPGGLLVVLTLSTANFIGRGAIKPPEHLVYFDEKNLSYFLSARGFDVLETKSLITWYALEDFISRVFGRVFNNRNNRFIGAVENGLVRMISGFGLRNASIPFFDGQFLTIAKKR